MNSYQTETKLEKLDLIIYGAGGHGNVILDIAEQQQIKIKFFIDKILPTENQFWGYPVFEENLLIPTLPLANYSVAIGNNATRKKVVETILDSALFITICHPKAIVSPRTTIGIGGVLVAGAVVNPGSVVGNHCIINTNASVGHDCKIANYVHIGPNVALSGNVAVGEGSWIGIGATVKQGIKIGKWCTIGAGAVVLNDVPDGCTVVGNPARMMNRIENRVV